MVTDEDVKLVVAIAGGCTALVGACFAGAAASKCYYIKTWCCECERAVPGAPSREGAEAQV